MTGQAACSTSAAEFEAEVRALLRRTAPDGRLGERAREIELVVWNS